MVFLIIHQPFFHVDEWFTQGLLTIPFKDMAHITASDMHPPFYYVTVWLPVKILNLLHIPFDKIFVMKMMSVMTYVLLFLISFTKIRKEYGWFTGGLFALTTLSMSNLFLYFSVARMYPLGLLLLVCGYITAGEILKESKLKNWITLTIFTILSIYTHYFLGISFAVLYGLLFLYVFLKNRPELKNWFISAVLCIICYIPWIAVLLQQMNVVHNSYWIDEITFNSILEFFASAFSTSSTIAIQSAGFIIFLVLLILVSITYMKSPDDQENEFILMGFLIFAGTIIVGVVSSFLFRPIIIARYLIPAVGVLWLSISIFISKFDFRQIIIPVMILILLFSAVNLYDQIEEISENHKYLVKDLNFLDSINNENSVVIITEQVKYVHYNQKLDKAIVYQNFSIDNREPAEDFATIYDDKDSKFLIPYDVEKYKDKTIYIANPKSNELNLPQGYSLEKVGQIERCEFSKLIHST